MSDTTQLLRYMFSVNSIFMQELVMYMHASVFMLAAAYTFRHDGHVRVDIFYRGMTPRRQALVNILGILLLLIPVMVFVIASSYGYVANSWRIMETSSVRNGYIFTGRITPPAADENHLEERV